MDIGSGWDDIVSLLIGKNKEINYTGVDFSKKLIEMLNKKFPRGEFPNLQFIHGNIKTINSQYGNVLALEVLEHIPSIQTFSFLNDAKRLVAPDGIFILSVPLYEDLRQSIYQCPECGKIFNKGMGHVRSYTPELIFKELDLAGFKIIEYKYIYWDHHTLKLKILNLIFSLIRILYNGKKNQASRYYYNDKNKTRGTEVKVICVIPARYGSTRFEGKPLAMISGKTMIYRVYEQAKKVKLIDEIYIATDDERIRNKATAFGANVIMTSKEHTCGTDRIAEAIQNMDGEVILNLQGDEPLINPDALDALIKPLIEDESINMATLITVIKDKKDYNNPNIAKVVKDVNNFALYFSRSLVPYSRDGTETDVFKQIGIYVYRRDFLLKFSKMEPTVYENIEKLEQLRALEMGYKIKLVETQHDSIAVDRPEDITKVEHALKKNATKKVT